MSGENISQYVEDDKLRVRVVPNSSKSEIVGFDSDRNAVLVKLKSLPVKGKANEELIKLVSKELGKKVIIKKGLIGRDKVLLVT